MNRYSIKVYLSLILATLLFFKCTKEKVSDNITLQGGLNQSNSSIRIYNLNGFNLDVSVNNIPLTPYGQGSGNSYSQAIFNGGYFTDGSSFTVPNVLLDKNGRANVVLTLGKTVETSGAILPPGLTQPIDTTITSNPLNPMDYYVLSTGHFLAIPHTLAAPAKPSDFKIRVLNLTTGLDINNIGGPVTLTYADGSLVDPAVTNITPGATTSYVELPYGAYEFKLFVANGQQINISQQVSILRNSAQPEPNYNGGNESPVYVQDQRFIPSKDYEPGGVYTIVVSSNVAQYDNGFCTPEFVAVNSFHIITETNPATNVTFARLQAVNTLPVPGAITIKVDGQPIGSSMAFGTNTPYSPFIYGTHVVEADDAQGNALARASTTLYANDNITAWIYANGTKPAICFVSNDLSGINSNAELQYRFLNLASNVPYATFQGAGSDLNDTLGKATIAVDPYYTLGLAPVSAGGCGSPVNVYGFGFSWIVFQSNPNSPQSTLYLPDVAPISNTNFIANPNLYIPGDQPLAEPGAYTVALIGTEGATGPFAPRMFILKHSK